MNGDKGMMGEKYLIPHWQPYSRSVWLSDEWVFLAMGNFIGKHVQAVNAQSLLLILESTRLRSYGSKKCYVRAEFPSSFKMFSSLADTGWSKETVNCNFSLTDMKIKKNGANSLFWPNPKRQEFFTYIFWDIKISKPHYMPFLKSFDIFLNFHVCQREITIHSLFWSPCYR